jgi:outer membrane receptor protein involved in Fe transport
MYDLTGGPLTTTHQFGHFNPMGGLTYKLTPQISAFGSYSVANLPKRTSRQSARVRAH